MQVTPTATTRQDDKTEAGLFACPAAEPAPRWYAITTRSRHEKAVAEQLRLRDVEHYLPLFHSRRRWKDRTVELDLPLFPGYLFVRLAQEDRLQVLTIPGVVRLVGCQGRPTPLHDEEIGLLQRSLELRRAEPSSYVPGRRVRIHSGPLQGLEGVVMRHNNRMRIVVSVDTIMRSFAVELEAADLEAAA